MLAGMDVEFSGEVFEWRGPAPFFWVRLSEDAAELIRAEATQSSYGWGAIPVEVRLGETVWETSLLPKDGGYVVPLKDAVRRAEGGVGTGDDVSVGITIAPRGGRAAGGTGPTC